MTDERLLLATALVHALPGAQLTAVDNLGRRIVVGEHPSCDVDSCRWRSTLVASLEGRVRHVADGMQFDTVGGSLEPAATGGFIDRNTPEKRWFAALLPPCVAVDTLRNVELGMLPEEAVSATVRPDPELGVTIVGVSIDAPCMIEQLDQLGGDVAAALAVAELCTGLPVRKR
ncbi:MAG: hypothetical protein AAGC53_03430 [Actinomycetota bacterium]